MGFINHSVAISGEDTKVVRQTDRSRTHTVNICQSKESRSIDTCSHLRWTEIPLRVRPYVSEPEQQGWRLVVLFGISFHAVLNTFRVRVRVDINIVSAY